MSESFHQRNDQKFATNTQQTCHQSRQNTQNKNQAHSIIPYFKHSAEWAF